MKNLVTLVLISISLLGSAFGAGQIDIAYSPYTINNPGSYIVVKDLTTAQNLNCITINTSNVSIDLNGHTLYGAGTTIGSTGYGVYCSNGNAISVTNGIIRDFRQYGINIFGLAIQVSRVHLFGNYNGSYFLNGKITDCSVENNAYDGIGTGYSSLIQNNIACFNGLNGIICGDGSVITNNVADNNGSYGISATGGCTITGNGVSSNTSAGIYCNGVGETIINNNSYANGDTGISTGYACTIIGNNIYRNGSYGIVPGDFSLVKDNTSSGNLSGGISCFNNNQIIGNNCSVSTSGGALGIYAAGTSNIILNNTITNNYYGLYITSGGNFHGGNILRSNTVSTTVAANNSTGNGVNGSFGDFVVP